MSSRPSVFLLEWILASQLPLQARVWRTRPRSRRCPRRSPSRPPHPRDWDRARRGTTLGCDGAAALPPPGAMTATHLVLPNVPEKSSLLSSERPSSIIIICNAFSSLQGCDAIFHPSQRQVSFDFLLSPNKVLSSLDGKRARFGMVVDMEGTYNGMSFLIVWGSLRGDAKVTGYLPRAKLV